MEKTAVECLVQEINKINVSTEARIFINKLEIQGKERERQQFIDLHIETMKEGLQFEDSQVWDEKYLPKIKSMAEKTWDKTFKSE
jgi:hypothetical protein